MSQNHTFHKFQTLISSLYVLLQTFIIANVCSLPLAKISKQKLPLKLRDSLHYQVVVVITKWKIITPAIIITTPKVL